MSSYSKNEEVWLVMVFNKATNDCVKGTDNELDDMKMRIKVEYLELVAKHEPELNWVAEKRSADNRQINVRFRGYARNEF